MPQSLDKEMIMIKFNEMYKDKLIIGQIDEIDSLHPPPKGEMGVKCKRCNHSWGAAIKNVIYFRAGCYECCGGRGYSMDEIKILNFIIDNYIPKGQQVPPRHAGQGGQLVVRPKKGNAAPPMFYSCDGHIRPNYEYGQGAKGFHGAGGKEGSKGTVFGAPGDYHHSNPLCCKPDEMPARAGLTHRQNYGHTMNGLKHIGELGYKVFHTWITDFRGCARGLGGGGLPHLFDFINVEKKYEGVNSADYSLLTKGAKKIFFCSNKGNNQFKRATGFADLE